MSTFVIMQGLPRSGKSSYTKKLSEIGFVGIELDQVRLELTKSVYEEDSEPYVWDIAREMIIKSLSEGENVYVDESNPNIRCIDFWAKALNSINDIITVRVVRIDTPMDECLSRTDDEVLRNAIRRKSSIMNSIDEMRDYCISNGYEFIVERSKK